MEQPPPIEDIIRKPYEPDVQWNLRRAFIVRNEGKMDRRKLFQLSDNLMKMEFVGQQIRYPIKVYHELHNLAGNLWEEFRTEKKLARIRDYGEYSVENGLDDFVLLMMRNDKEALDSGVGLTEDRLKSIIQDSARLCGLHLRVEPFLTNGRLWETEILLDGKLIAFAEHRSRNLSIKLAFESSFWLLLQSQHQIVVNDESYEDVEEFVFDEAYKYVPFRVPSIYANFTFKDSPIRYIGFEEMGFGGNRKHFNLPFDFSVQAQNFLKTFVSEQSLEVLDFSTDLSRRQRDIVCELAYALNLDVWKVHDGREDRVQVKVMHCPPYLAMELFWLMYQVVEEEDDHPIFRKASLCNRNLM